MVPVLPGSLMGVASVTVTGIAGKGDSGLGTACFAVDSASPGLPGSLCDTESVRVTFAAGKGETGSGAAGGTAEVRGSSPVDALAAPLLVFVLASDVSVPSTGRNRPVLRPRRRRGDGNGVLRAAGKLATGSFLPCPFSSKAASPSAFCQMGSKRPRGRGAKRREEAVLSLASTSHPEPSCSVPEAVNATRKAQAKSWARA